MSSVLSGDAFRGIKTQHSLQQIHIPAGPFRKSIQWLFEAPCFTRLMFSISIHKAGQSKVAAIVFNHQKSINQLIISCFFVALAFCFIYNTHKAGPTESRQVSQVIAIIKIVIIIVITNKFLRIFALPSFLCYISTIKLEERGAAEATYPNRHRHHNHHRPSL